MPVLQEVDCYLENDLTYHCDSKWQESLSEPQFCHGFFTMYNTVQKLCFGHTDVTMPQKLHFKIFSFGAEQSYTIYCNVSKYQAKYGNMSQYNFASNTKFVRITVPKLDW